MSIAIKTLTGVFSFMLVVAGLFSAQTYSQTQPSSEPSDHEREKIERIVREYLLRKPELLVEMTAKLEERRNEAQKRVFLKNLSSIRNELFNSPTAPILGNPDGKTVIAEFSDYNCPYCRQMAPLIKDAIKSNPDLKVVLREFPILSPASRLAAQAVLAARYQNKYEEFHFALFSVQERLDEKAIFKIAARVGLNIDRLKRDMKRPEIDKMLQRNLEFGEMLGIQGTPAFVAGDQLAPGAISKEQLSGLISAAGKSANY